MKLIKKLQKLLHWERATKPEIDLSAELYEHLKPFRLPVILLILTMLIGSMGYMLIDDFSLMDAIYQTGITFTTVGFGEISPISGPGRIFTINLIIAGFVIFTFSVGILVNEIDKGELFKIIKERRMLYKIATLKKHLVICYHNEYTIQLSRVLRESNIPFVVIDPRPDLEKIAKKHKYPYFVQEEPHTEVALLKSHLSSAKGVISLSKNIADNIAQIASVRLFEKEIGRRSPYLIICNAETLSDMEKLKKLGADNVVAPAKLTAQRISAMAIRPDMENILEEFLYKKDTPLDLEEIYVPKYSWMVLKKLKDTHLRDIANVSVVGIREKDGKFIPMPKGDTIINSESKLLVIGTSKGISLTKRLARLAVKPEELKYV
ncbi:potassium channel family protein [Nitrosophilus alvini]|uniref:potassium channel family protein n=1 Tax=Nitrosophilus alvini TaxID=2714855 RepID=UPI00190B134D|nr:potassium channel protein [Nitrosophilus alvini]